MTWFIEFMNPALKMPIMKFGLNLEMIDI
jgi:hypothetical protein